MSFTLKVQIESCLRNLSIAGSDSRFCSADATATLHDYLDSTPLTLATSGDVGTVFLDWPTSVIEIERIIGFVPPAADLIFRFGGAVAEVTSVLNNPSAPLDTLTLTLSFEGGSPVTTTFTGADTTMALAAKRINYAHGAQVASLSTPDGFLVLTGARTGGADAKVAGYLYGEVNIISGTAATALGLTIGVTSGAGTDERVGAGPYARTFPTGNLPTNFQISGSATGLSLLLAGTAT